VGGAERQTIALAEAMARRGHFVAFLTLKHADEELPVALPVMRLNMAKTPGGIARGLRFARNFVTLVRPDILHSHTFPANLFARLLRLAMVRDKDRPAVINTIHNVYEGGWHRRLIYAATHPLADCITAVSDAAAVSHAGGSEPGGRGIRVVPNGIDVDAYAADPDRRMRTRALMGAVDNFIWLAVGRVVPAKDYPNLLRAWLTVRAKHATARLWIAGEGDAGAIAHDVVSGDDSDRLGIEWLGLRRDIADLLDAADAYVLSSAWEGMPLAVAEAMAMQKPIVATDVGGVGELLGEAGLLTTAGDSAALAAAMLAVMAMGPGGLQAMGKRARERVEAHFSLGAIADAWEALYIGVAGSEAAV
jgi:glycosyltransferase involved in cell wall biosynthesis